MKKFINKKYFVAIFVSIVAIPALIVFMQNCAKNSSSPVAVAADTPVVIVSTTMADINLSEGSTANFSVSLNTQPTSTVTITATSNNTDVATVAPATLSFTPSNWNMPQAITLSGVEDDNAENEDTTITVVGTGLPTLTLAVHTTDNDILALYTNVSTVNLNENANATFEVKLSAQPSASTLVNINSLDMGAATVSPSSVTFTSANWNTPQIITVSGVDDADIANEDVSISATSTGLTSLNVNAHVVDNDTLLIVTDLNALAVNEGSSVSLGVKLNVQPLSNTTVNVAVLNAAKVSISLGLYTFTPANWNTYQYIVVSGMSDPDTFNESTTLVLTNSGVPSKSVIVYVNDTTQVIACGNGLVQAAEECDDANTVNGDGCAATCITEAGYTCSGNPSVCQVKLAQGAACAADSACLSGFCTDGICCGSRCGGVCEKCNLAGRLGFCDPISAGIDLDNECATSAVSTCGRSGQCSGARSCALYSAGQVCEAASCSGNVAVPANTCDGLGTCVSNSTVNCSSVGKTCVAGACQ